jgi:hypothetical protein
MADDAYITNPSQQQGEATIRKGTRGPANANANIQATVPPADSPDEGPEPVPDHAGKPPHVIKDTPR